eukprot:CAMPEP_0171140774 /NCGR_PEP_ID=MMETSP0766_2-20121228/139383_1 /TAXON_ID=439317 /ORGANISM="Gambierdiscus australes, Strain CAWD 149" /LENGTH=52 /DNA_ID=CAMNT_0011604477 /DNA_START=51 /DNA_END=205 /DNA_ORIENTATION=-
MHAAEAEEALGQSRARLHDHEPQVILLIDPSSKVSLFIREDAPCIRPVPAHA